MRAWLRDHYATALAPAILWMALGAFVYPKFYNAVYGVAEGTVNYHVGTVDDSTSGTAIIASPGFYITEIAVDRPCSITTINAKGYFKTQDINRPGWIMTLKPERKFVQVNLRAKDARYVVRTWRQSGYVDE